MHFTKFAIALALAGTAVSAFAGPDWTVIERARAAAHQAHEAVTPAQEQPGTDPCAQMMQRTTSSSAQWQGNAVESHGTTNSGGDAGTHRAWGNVLSAVTGARDPFLDGGRMAAPDVVADDAMHIAGMDTTGVSAPPARARDPYTDGARADVSQQA